MRPWQHGRSPTLAYRFMDLKPNRARINDTALAALLTSEVDEKLQRVAAAAGAIDAGKIEIATEFVSQAPELPGRPARPELVSPRALQRRSAASARGHSALIHAVAHIEFNAINLALDAVCRFPRLPVDFYRDWMDVAAEEAIHFRLLRDHLRTSGHDYGDFAAHDGLWQMAIKTAHDPLVRMALVPRVLEARGLDASPGIIRRLRAAGDADGAAILEIILRDEVGHVAIGTRWFNFLCVERGLNPGSTFAALLRAYDAPRPVLPLNLEARRQADFSADELQLVIELATNGRAARGR